VRYDLVLYDNSVPYSELSFGDLIPLWGSPMISIPIAIVNASTVVNDAEVQGVTKAIQIQLDQHFAPIWGVSAQLFAVKLGAVIPSTAWWLVILDNSDIAGAFGYHDLTNAGLPLGKVFAETDEVYGKQWSLAASHEIIEMLADPFLTRSVIIRAGMGYILVPIEVCDVCQHERYGYVINDTLVSNFVYPAWFCQSQRTGNPRLDHERAISFPLQILPDCFALVWDVTFGTGWHQVSGGPELLSYATRPRVGSRRQRRTMLRSSWLRSSAAIASRPERSCI
jgi:hypothetical protein